MFIGTLTLVTLVVFANLNIKVGARRLPPLSKTNDKDNQEVFEFHKQRLKREASQCCGSGKCKDNQGNTPREIIIHHYHHHYYYCCPSSGPGHNTSVRCDVNKAGGVSCKQTPPTSPPCGDACDCSNKQDQNKNKNTFGFGMMFNDPVGKQFFDFISKNFVKKDNNQQQSGSVCSTSSNPFGFEDPICNEFFNFFTQNFVKKTYPTSAPPITQVPTQQQNTQGNTNFGEFEDINTMFDAFKNEMKDTLSKTAEMAKKLGGNININ